MVKKKLKKLRKSKKPKKLKKLKNKIKLFQKVHILKKYQTILIPNIFNI